jgi:formate hydrogenlyase transcriptional activator
MPNASSKQPSKDLLHAVSEATSGLTGYDLLLETAKQIVAVLQMQYCFIAECANEDKTRLRTMVFVNGNTVMDTIEYNTEDSGCSMMMKGDAFFLPAGAQKRFKGAKGLEAYIGAPIISPVTGEILGHIAATDPNPVSNEKDQTAVLRIFAARIGAELERMKVEKELEKKNKELQDKLNDIERYNNTLQNLQQKMEEDLLRTVSEATAGFVGEDFLIELAKHITLTLNMRYALITECANDDKTKLRTLCYIDGRKVLDNIEYDIDGAPCEVIMQGREFFMNEGVQAKFPKEKGIEAAVGVPIYSSKSGAVIGHILALDPDAVTTEKNQTAILKIFAARAGAEIERMKAENKLKETLMDANVQLQLKLKESEQRYRDLFEEAPIAYVNEGLDSKFITANRAALQILGIREEDIPNTYGFSFIPGTPEAQKRVKDAFEAINRGENTSGITLELRRKDNGQPLWIQWWSKPDPSGQFTRTMFIDITNQVLMEQEQAKLKAQNQYLRDEIKLSYNFEEIVSKSTNFQRMLKQIEQVASTDATVLILGESGTGKELIARAVHHISNRSKKPLVKVNCATLPSNLIESELFGHEKGAFTGAMERKIGRFELADGGTIFLDEIGELPVELQAKLLRVLQEGEFERLGNPKTMKVNVRVIAATNRNLQQAIEKKEFREDLFYRLNVFPVTCPPLRSRKEDIPLLVKHFCHKHEGKVGRKITEIPTGVMDALMAYDWPGNIRELENIIERAMILSSNGILEYGDWIPSAKSNGPDNGKAFPSAKLEEVEKIHIIDTLKRTGWKVSGEKGAARILGLNPTTLEARMKKLGIKREN